MSSLTKAPPVEGAIPPRRAVAVDRRRWWEVLIAAGAHRVFTTIQTMRRAAILKDPSRPLPPAPRGADRGVTPDGGSLLPRSDPPATSRSLRALVITGEQPMAEALAGLMYREGLSAEWVGTGSLGLRLVESVDPDLVLLDALMTGPDGSAIGPLLRARSGAPVILICSGENGDGCSQDPPAAAYGQIEWPFSAADVATVRRVLNRVLLATSPP